MYFVITEKSKIREFGPKLESVASRFNSKKAKVITYQILLTHPVMFVSRFVSTLGGRMPYYLL